MSGSQYNPDFNQPVYGAVIGEHNAVTINVSQLPSSRPQITFRSIIGIPPPSDNRTIQQRTSLVEAIYTKLNETDLNALVLTGIGGVGKSTIAALVYEYIQAYKDVEPFTAPPLWLTIDPSATFVDLAGTIYLALNQALPSLDDLSFTNQAQVLFNTLATMKSPRLLVLDQFENFLDWNTGVALLNHPAVDAWLDALNSQPFQTGCRLLLTSRPHPKGSHKYAAIYLYDYSVDGLTTTEGAELLRKQGVQEPETELQRVVDDCNGHPLSLTLLAALVHDYQMPLAALLDDPKHWGDDIATHLLDTIFTRLNDIQRDLLRAFSVYNSPVPLEAVILQMQSVEQKQAFQALRTLLTQHLIQPVGEGRYQLHIIVANYFKQHFVEGDTQANKRAVQKAQVDANHYQNRQRMLARVHTIWIKGVLEQRLYGTPLIPLKFVEQSDILTDPQHITLREDSQEEYALPEGTRITQVFDDARGTLLILGEPGCGKTTLLLELASDLLKRAEKDEVYPIPVIFHLSSWVVNQHSLTEWLIEELNSKYQVPLKIAKEWIRANQVIPLLDGLDEAYPRARMACVQAINTYRREHSLVPIVVCSRRAEYMAEKIRVQLNNAIIIEPLTMKQIDAHLAKAGSQLEILRQMLSEDSELREFTTAPQMLALLIATYKGALSVDPSKTPMQQVTATYVQHNLQRQEINSHYTSKQIYRWLAWLARQMLRHNQMVFYIERLQPDWLQDHRSRLAYSVIVILIIALVGGVVFALVGGLISALVGGLVFALVGGIYLGQHRNIQPSEIITWSWKRVLSKPNRILFWTVAFGLVIGLGARVIGGLMIGLGTGLVSGIGVGLLYIQLLGFSSEMQETHILFKPNLGIWRSVRNGIFIGLTAGLVGLLLGGSIGNVFGDLLRGSEIGGLVFGLLGWFIFGGYAFIQHFVLRFLLWCVQSTPWNFSHFLDLAAGHMVLRKIGGGYIFSHRLILEYFAPLDEKKE